VRIGLRARSQSSSNDTRALGLGMHLELRWTVGRRGDLLRLRDALRPAGAAILSPELQSLLEDGWLDPDPLETTP